MRTIGSALEVASDVDALNAVLNGMEVSDAAYVLALMFMLGGFILVMGVLFTIPTVTVVGPEVWRRKVLRERGVPTTARVLANKKRPDFAWQHIVTVEWVDPDGTTREHRQIWEGAQYGQGDEVDAVYDPQKPSRMQVFDQRGPRLTSPRHEWLIVMAPVVLFPLGLVVLAAAMAAALATSSLDVLIEALTKPPA